MSKLIKMGGVLLLLIFPGWVIMFSQGQRIRLSTDVRVTGPDRFTIGASKQHQFECRVKNSSDQAIQFTTPVTSCGCISIANEGFIIEPKSEKVLSFNFRAPKTPGLVRKRVDLHSPQYPGMLWSTDVFAEVVADVWGEPWEVNLTSKEPLSRVVVRSRPDVEVQSVESTDPHISLVAIDAAVDGARPFDVILSPGAPKRGKSLIQVSWGSSGQQVEKTLDIPVRWGSGKLVQFVPKSVHFGPKKSAAKAILIQRLGKDSQVTLLNGPDWLVVTLKPSGAVWTVELEADMARSEDESVLEFEIKSDNQTETIQLRVTKEKR